jgi:serine/threonine-protein kinase RsbW
VTASPRVIRLTIPAKAEYITLCRLALAGISQLRDISDETLHDLKLALTEACTNSVRHAYEAGSEGSVQIVYEIGDEDISIEVIDEGEGFVLDEASETDHLSESGLGIAIIRSLADELAIEPREGRGSRLRFVKHLGAAA